MMEIAAMPRRVLALLALAPLAACAHDQNMSLSPAPAHMPLVQRAERVLDLATGANGLAPGEAKRLSGYLDGIEAGFGHRVATNATGPARAAIARIVAARGLSLTADPSLPAPSETSARVVVSQATATVSGCPDWAEGDVPASAGATSRNFGCATKTNLAAMIADPEDLTHGRDNGGASDPRVGVKAIQVWREAKPTGQGGLKTEGTGGGQGGGNGQ